MKPLQFGKHKSSIIAPQEKITKDIAIIGVHGVFPGADNPQEFWNKIYDKENLIKEIPQDHFDYKPWYNPEKGVEDMLYTKWGSFINNVDQFDADFFNISPVEAEMMDPQLRYLMQVLYHTIEDAGTINTIKGSNTGLYVGACFHDYGQEMDRINLTVNPHDGTGNAATMLANRPSFYFDLKGPSIVIDTACSSSLIAIHTACKAIQNNECDQALVAGANLLLSSVHYRYFSSIGALSATGRCHSFDSQADGYIPGESVAAIMLKPLAQAEKDGDFIHGIIKGSATTHGGYTPSITAPSVDGEMDVLLKAWKDAGISPESLGYIEAHGTGTKLGDPIEINALKKAYKKHTDKTDFCAVGSAKAHIGHAEGAAGIVGVIKAMFSIKNKKIPAMPQFKEINPYINLQNSPFYINKEVQDWENKDGNPLRAGVSSFGFGGAYAHVVLEEYTAKMKNNYTSQKAALIILSAKSPKVLQSVARNLNEFISQNPNSNIYDIAYTLQIAREPFDVRAGFQVKNIEELKEKLKEVENESLPVSTINRAIHLSDTKVNNLIQEGNLDLLLEKWQTGAPINWKLLYEVDSPNKILLPNYPFSKKRYWMPKSDKTEVKESFFAQLHPLVHLNASTLNEIKFKSTYKGSEFFLSDHAVLDVKILPGVAYIELIRAAAEISAEKNITAVKNITWMNPIPVEANPKEIEIKIVQHSNELKAEVKSTIFEKELIHCEAEITITSYPTVKNKLHINDFITGASRIITAKELYDDFAGAGLNLGDSFQLVTTLYVKDRVALAKVKNEQKAGFKYNPGILDSALHTIYGLVIFPGQHYSLAFPYHVKEVIFHNAITADMELWAMAKESQHTTSHLTSYDVDLFNSDGEVILQFKEFVAIPLKDDVTVKSTIDNTYLPVWKRMTSDEFSEEKETSVLIVTGTGNQDMFLLEPLLEQLKEQGTSIKIVEEIAPNEDKTDSLYFVHGLFKGLQHKQISIEKKLFESLKKVSHIAKDKKLNLCFFTKNTQAVYTGEEVDALGSGIIGLVGSIAKEYPDWSTRIIDLGTTDWNAVFIKEQQKIPYNTTGTLHVYRNGFFYRQVLHPLQLNVAKSKIKKKGIYVILGGAGGIGAITTQYLADKYQAQVIWLGRRASDTEIQKKQDEIAVFGPRPVYFQCDALDATALSATYAAIKTKYGRVNGLFHSAIVLNDMRFENMNAANFDHSYLPKSLASKNLVNAFNADKLDFVCFYSSIQSQWNAAGQSNYSAGCTFKDSYAREIESVLNVPSYTINWGYWGGAGIVSGDAYARRMNEIGIGSISNVEGMAILEAILSNEVRQVIAINLSVKAKAMVDNLLESERYQILTVPSIVDVKELQKGLCESHPEEEQLFQRICEKGLLQSLLKMDLAHELRLCKSIEDLELRLGIQKKYTRLFEELIRTITSSGYLVPNDTFYELSAETQELTTHFDLEESLQDLVDKNKDYKSHSALLKLCLHNFSAVLRGSIQATELLFPEGSMENVNGIYKGNKQADYMNELIASTVVQFVSNSLKSLAPGEKIRIMEVGAGTGGTSELIFSKLASYKNDITYTYTDISKSFLLYGESQYKTVAPYLETQLFNIEEAAASQGLVLGSYDIVLGANVVHATANINNTISNIKQVLKPNGLLLLNELATTELFTTLTFGLLDGWWLYSDAEIRLPGSPGLSDKQWQQVLHEEGFTAIQSYPENQNLPQQMIIAKSNGVVKNKIERADSEKLVSAEKWEKENQNKGDDSQWLIEELIRIAAATIKHSEEKFDIHRQFMDYGFDSILGATLIKNINKKLEITLSPTEIFSYPNISELANYIQSHFSFQIEQKIQKKPVMPLAVEFPKTTQDNLEAFNQVAQDDIAIIGMSGQFGSANDLNEYWEALRDGRSLIEEIPPQRWDKDVHYSADQNAANKTYSKWGSFLKDVDKFDTLFFGISGAEAEMMDPQQRLFLQHAWKSIEDAGINPKTLSNKKCGVYAGVSTGDYLDTAENKPASAFWGNSSAILPSRISYLLNLKGPALSIDTACSSSLVALDLGCKSLISKENDIVITGGITIMNSPNFYKLSSRAGMLSADGKTYAFDQRANGFVPGEGVGVLMLKRLADAEKDGDVIHGVIKGSMVNQDGTSNGILAPSVLSQENLEKETYTKFNINPKTISYVETHGTGTPLGDPIEFEALTKSFNAFSCPKQNCAIGSVKTNIGHTLMAAGVAGIIKVLLSFKNQQLPPSLNFGKANALIDFENSPFRLQEKLGKWETEEGIKRRAAVSSFGFSGTNAHIILEEYIRNVQNQDAGRVLILISAKTENSLRNQAQNLKSYLEESVSVNLTNIAYTLQSGRENMHYKLAFIIQTKEEFIKILSDFINEENGYKYQREKNTAQNQKLNQKVLENEIKNSLRDKNINDLMQYWIEGIEINWALLYEGNIPQKISLPTYSFEKQTYWKPNEQPVIDSLQQTPVFSSTRDEVSIFEQNWKKGALEAGQRRAGMTLIISNSSNPVLLQALQQNLGQSKVVAATDVITEMENISGCIDLSPLENHNEENFDWLLLLQNCIKENNSKPLTLVIVSDSGQINLDFAERFGLYQMLQAEYSRINSLSLELDQTDPKITAQVITEAYYSTSGYTRIKYKKSKWYFPFLEKLECTTIQKQLAVENPVLITGGTGGLGLECAKHLALTHGFKKIILLGRKQLPARNRWNILKNEQCEAADKIKTILELENRGVQIKLIAAETLEKGDMKSLLFDIQSDWGPIKGLLHCAGNVDLNSPAFVHKELSTIQTVLNSKVKVIEELEEILRDNQLDFAILFSSISTFPVLGSGQSDYVMANSYLNYFARLQQQKGKAYTSVQWPDWENVGMKKIKGSLYDQIGLASITVQQGLAILDKIIISHQLPAILAPIAFADPHFELNQLFEIKKKKMTERKNTVEETNISDWVRALMAKELKLPIEVLDIRLPFQDFGVDSVILVQLIKALERELPGVNIDPTVLLENPTINMLGNYIEKNFPAALSGMNAVVEENIQDISDNPTLIEADAKENTQKQYKKNAPIAVVGMACHFPEAADIRAFWDNLKNGTDAISEVPESRWNAEEFYSPEKDQPGKSISKWGGFLKDIEKFDPGYFGIKEELASQIDPLQRQWLEVCTEAIADSGYLKEDLSGKAVGVYGGSRLSTFRNKIKEPCRDFIIGTGQNFITAHLSHIYNLKGPNLVVDTACSSSLTAIDLAVKDLRLGETDMALAGGVDIILDEEIFISLSRLSILSPSGRSKTFDQSADGTGLGEGCGVIILKRLEDAIAAGDKIYGVIEGTAVNNDGRTMGVTTPNPTAQEELIEKGIANAGIPAASISYIESHGTGTLIGDPIELTGVTRVLRKHTDKNAICGIGSVKSNIGHLLSAAGIAGVIKTLLAINAKKIPPTLHCETPNVRFNFDSSPIYPVTELKEWEGVDGVRRAGISAFGLGGNNAFVLVSDEGIPERNKVQLPFKRPEIVFNRSRYWPQEEKTSQREKSPKKNNKVFDNFLNFEIKEHE
ncbi:SDR family NAD(P)-dependent oxidoreductase [Flavobacterium circumlabens]|uniref:Polyketide synthase PksM n=1 Tax=Flavobacterium circumlabens TaxID=2133765 RepID=A0A4Y7UBY7_9FLAO|nr:SDR family NAD(P)-dependent oxidoreductase [Flavobacterium circumlabens]TCN57663.1 polyketide synthase PksM [Flavobacterium circumlabens]TEB43967.1 SDR family NAD(P)-dependent oxidoreductase [Flavobacterium circumlabens]